MPVSLLAVKLLNFSELPKTRSTNTNHWKWKFHSHYWDVDGFHQLLSNKLSLLMIRLLCSGWKKHSIWLKVKTVDKTKEIWRIVAGKVRQRKQDKNNRRKRKKYTFAFAFNFISSGGSTISFSFSFSSSSSFPLWLPVAHAQQLNARHEFLTEIYICIYYVSIIWNGIFPLTSLPLGICNKRWLRAD